MWRILFILLMLSCPEFLSAQKTNSKKPAKASSQKSPDLGKLRGNIYTNEFFELKVEFPSGWLVGDNQLESSLFQLSQPQVRMTDPKNQGSMDKAIQRLTPLLGGYRSLPGSSVENSSLRIVAERLLPALKINTGKDYVAFLLRQIKAMTLPPGFTYKEPKNETIDEQSLDYLDSTFGASKKRLYVTVRKGFAVLITIEYFNENDFKELHEVLKNAELDYKK